MRRSRGNQGEPPFGLPLLRGHEIQAEPGSIQTGGGADNTGASARWQRPLWAVEFFVRTPCSGRRRHLWGSGIAEFGTPGGKRGSVSQSDRWTRYPELKLAGCRMPWPCLHFSGECQWSIAAADDGNRRRAAPIACMTLQDNIGARGEKLEADRQATVRMNFFR